MPFPIVSFKNIKKCFGSHVVLSGIDLDIYAGEIFGLIGASGAGKTTFLNTIIGFLEPDAGDVSFNLNSLVSSEIKDTKLVSIKNSASSLKKIIGYASQSPSLYHNLTVEENIEYFGTLYNLSGRVIRENKKTLLALLDLENARHTLARNLSGGMQRRLDIACAMVHDPRILILDEPTADLDPHLSLHMWELINAINRRGTTIIVSSHHLTDMEKVCTRIGVLAKGKISIIGSAVQYKKMLVQEHEIHLESFPGNYDKICQNAQSITKRENRGHELVISTTKPDIILKRILSDLEKMNESVIDIRIQKTTLDDLFRRKEFQ